MDKCPKCRAALSRGLKYTFVCGTSELTAGVYDDGKECLRRQLAAANERAGRYKEALRYYADPVVWSRPYDHAQCCEWAPVELDNGHIARKALEVPDA